MPDPSLGQSEAWASPEQKEAYEVLSTLAGSANVRIVDRAPNWIEVEVAMPTRDFIVTIGSDGRLSHA